MGRHVKLVTITAEGRDKGKTFRLTELPADQGEWWAIRALSVMGDAGVSMPAGTVEAGMAGLASMETTKHMASAMFVVGLRMLPGVNTANLKPLLDEMMTCVEYVPPNVRGVTLPAQSLSEGEYSQIEEIATRLKLRADVLELHLGFSLAGAASTSDTTQSPAPA